MKKNKKDKNKKLLTYILLGISIFLILINIVINIKYLNNNLLSLINYVILIFFSLFFTLYIINCKEAKYTLLNISLSLFLVFNLIVLNNSFVTVNISPLQKFASKFSLNSIPDFTNKPLEKVITWANENNITLNETYENSDIVTEQNIIYQSIKTGSSFSKNDTLDVIVSDGPSKDKEIILSDLTTHNLEDVLKYIEENYLNNVKIEYEISDFKEDSLIKQSKIGTVKRSDAITFTFSLGAESKGDNVKLISLYNMSKLRAEAYLAKYKINYEFQKDFSSSIKKDHIIKQSISEGNTLNINNDKLILTLSKGKKIEVPELKEMSLDKILKFISTNKLRIEIEEKFDDTIQKGKVISASVNKGDIIEEKTTIKLVLSKGKITMPEFKDIEEFKAWAEKNGIGYQIEYEASDDVENGKIISFSHKTKDVIKNGDTITVVISSGKQITVPNFIGMSKQAITKKCNSINLKCSFQYSSSTKTKDTAIRQSLTAGSKVAEKSSISITLSNGKTTTNSKTNTNSNTNSNSSSSNQNNNNQQTQTPTTPSTPTPSCTPQEITITRELNNIFSPTRGYQYSYDALQSYFAKLNVKINIVADSTSSKASGSFISGVEMGSKVTTCCPNDCKTYTIVISK